jgi:hypothetical protein
MEVNPLSNALPVHDAGKRPEVMHRFIARSSADMGFFG